MTANILEEKLCWVIARPSQAPQAPPPFLLMDIFPGPLGWFNSTDVSFIPGIEQRLEKS